MPSLKDRLRGTMEVLEEDGCAACPFKLRSSGGWLRCQLGQSASREGEPVPGDCRLREGSVSVAFVPGRGSR